MSSSSAANAALIQKILELAEQLSQGPQDTTRVLEVAQELRTLSRSPDLSPCPAPASLRGEQPDQEQIAVLLERLKDPSLPANTLLALCRAPATERALWRHAPDVYPLVAEKLLQIGDPIMAYNIISEGLNSKPGQPGNLRLRQLQGLALSRSGATRLAHKLLADLHDEGHRDAETLGLLARTHKDQGFRAKQVHDRTDHFRRAYKLYRASWENHRDPWTGINAATMALFLRDVKSATELAQEVDQHCRQQLNAPGAPAAAPYWTLATLGQAALILKRLDEAGSWYTRAAQAGQGQFGNLATTRRDAQLLTEYLHLDPGLVANWLPLPNVVVFVGHMIDRDNRPVPRFPPLLERAVDRAMRDRLTRLNARIGYSSAACGSDILFLEAVQDLGNKNSETHVVLPYDRKLFVQDSVDIGPGHWKERFYNVLKKADEILTASEQRLELGGVSYEFSNGVLHGLAKTKAEQLRTGLKFLAVWDGRPGDGPGGTAYCVGRWKERGHEVEVIDLAELLRSSGHGGTEPTAIPVPPTVPVSPSESHPEFESTVMALLFADVVGFSKLQEAQIPHFVTEFLGMVDRLLPPPPRAPLKKNTWGDGLYFAFESVRDAGLFALDLCERVASTSWAAKNLPPELNLRVGLHAGPVFNCKDPITKQPNSIGTHVSRAARIEPITPQGEIYASQEFTALAASEGVTEFECSYVGLTSYAKGYGTFPLYHVHRR
jgi:class 3 adenylate cyclase